MNVPTIATTNMLTSYLVEEPQDEILLVKRSDTMIAATGGFRIRYGAGQLFVKSEDAQQVTVEVYTTDGRLIDSTTAGVKGGTAHVSVARLQAGFYVAQRELQVHEVGA